MASLQGENEDLGPAPEKADDNLAHASTPTSIFGGAKDTQPGKGKRAKKTISNFTQSVIDLPVKRYRRNRDLD